MKRKLTLISMLAFGLILVPTHVEGQVPDKKTHKVDKPSKHDRGRTHKVDREKIKERLKAAFAKHKKKRASDSKKHWKGFDRKHWKGVTDDEKAALREKMIAGRKEWHDKMKSHREEAGKRIKEIRKEFKNKRDKVIDGNDPGD